VITVDTREMVQIMKNDESHYEYLALKISQRRRVCTRNSQEDRTYNPPLNSKKPTPDLSPRADVNKDDVNFVGASSRRGAQIGRTA
jgi:hypothetical protein